jgi:hypothetical protein
MDMQERKAMARIFVDAFAAGVLQVSLKVAFLRL